MLQAIGTATFARRASLMPAATWLQASALRLDTTTLAPCSARRSTIALPMPFVEPVTSATLPVRSKRVIALLYQTFGGLCGARVVQADDAGRVRLRRGEREPPVDPGRREHALAAAEGQWIDVQVELVD